MIPSNSNISVYTPKLKLEHRFNFTESDQSDHFKLSLELSHVTVASRDHKSSSTPLLHIPRNILGSPQKSTSPKDVFFLSQKF